MTNRKQNPAESGVLIDCRKSAALPHYVSRLEKHRIIESLRVHPLSAAHTPDKEEGEGLIFVAQAAIAEASAPRVDGKRGAGSRRPVAA
jgi:hypothetical protein